MRCDKNGDHDSCGGFPRVAAEESRIHDSEDRFAGLGMESSSTRNMPEAGEL